MSPTLAPRFSALRWIAAALVGLVATVPTVAEAAPYEAFIDVDDEDDLYDLFITQQISEDTFNVLVDLNRRGVDLNEASRQELYTLPNLTYDEVDAIIAYREDAGAISEPAALVTAGVLTKRKLASIAMFLLVRDPKRRAAATNGWFRYQTAWTVEDTRVPPMALQARVTTLKHLTVGAVGVLNRNDIADPSWDPNRQGFATDGQEVRVWAPKAFVQWDTPDWGVVAGNYTIGFGQRLTFDSTTRYTPNGFYFDDVLRRQNDLVRRCKQSTGELASSPCNELVDTVTGGQTEADNVYATPDFDWTDRQRGVAAGAKHIGLPQGWLQTYGWFSHTTRSIYQYNVYNRDLCDDPRDDENDLCSAPGLYERRDDPLEPTAAVSFQSLPRAYNELLGGANVSYFYERRTHFGMTGYGSGIQWLIDGANLDFQEQERRPFGGSFGAIGADAAWGRRWADLFLEVSRSFDSMPNRGGGYAGIARHTATWRSEKIEANNEIEVTGRFYGSGYANPYAGPISQPDQKEGLRAQDEAGGRFRYTGWLVDRLRLRTSADFWTEPSGAVPKVQTFARGDVDVTRWFRPGLWVLYDNRDLRNNSHRLVVIPADRETTVAGCFGGDDRFDSNSGQLLVPEDYIIPNDESGEPIKCGGQRVRLTARMRFDPIKRLTIATFYQHDWQDDADYDTKFRQDSAANLVINTNPIDPLRIRTRIRYDFEDIENNSHLEQTLWAYLETSYAFLERRLLTRIRYDIRVWLDNRARTGERVPSPEHWLRLQLEFRF